MNLPDTFRGVSEKIFSSIPQGSDVIISTDSYHQDSIKLMERKRRGTADKLLINGPNMKRPSDWKMFLENSENKQSLTNILLSVWSEDSFASKIGWRKVIHFY